MSTATRPNPAAAADAFHVKAAEQRVVPLWSFFKEWFAAEPHAGAVPHVWRYAPLRTVLADSAEAVSTQEAERRVLALENPGLAGRRLATDTLYAGLQLIMPGEHARSHRHTAAALRFILEGSGAYTAVNGERAYMEPGDFIVTPSWAWHEHANDTATPIVWLDVLDVALVRFLGAGFSEHYREARFPERPPERAGERSGSPVFSHPYARSRETLERLKRAGDYDSCHALRMEYTDPARGGPAIPTLSTFLQLVPAGFKTAAYQSTASSIVAVVAGRGRVTAGSADASWTLEYGPRDLFALPSWMPFSIEATEESVLFSASDEAVQRTLGLWREQRGK